MEASPLIFGISSRTTKTWSRDQNFGTEVVEPKQKALPRAFGWWEQLCMEKIVFRQYLAFSDVLKVNKVTTAEGGN